MRFLTVAAALLVLLLPTGVSAAPGIDPEAVRLRVIEAVNADSANFGGVYLDVDGALVIQYVGANAGRAAVEERLEPGVAVRWVKVDRSHAELMRILRELRGRNLDGVVMISIDTMNNQVKVTVSPSEYMDDVSSAVKHWFAVGTAVAATDDPPVAQVCSNRTSCTRWRGGIRIDRNNGTGGCTWGFQASRNGNLQMITAGHCHATGGKFNHNGETIGSSGVGENGIDPATFSAIDVSRTKVTGANYPTTQNTLYATDSYKSWALSSIRPHGNMAVNQTVAKSGITTNYTTGVITDTYTEYKLIPRAGAGSLVHYPNCTYTTQSTCPWVWGVVTNLHSEAGDSGSPVYSTVNANVPPMGTALLGILSAGNEEITIFAAASAAEYFLHLDFWCTTAGCP